MLLSEALVDFTRRELTLRGRSEATKRGYQLDLRQFLNHVARAGGDIPEVKSVTDTDIEDFLLDQVDRGLKARTVRRRASAIRSFFRWAHRAQLCDGNPAADLPVPRVEYGMPYCPTPDEVRDIIRRCNEPLTRAILATLFYTGIRVGELCQLKVDDVILSRGILLVRRGKGGRSRTIPLARTARLVLSDYVTRQRPETPSPWLFATGRTGQLSRNWAIELVRRERIRQGLPYKLTPHTMRHAFATALHELGVDLRRIQVLLGHTSLTTLQHYTHVRARHLENAVAVLEPAAD